MNWCRVLCDCNKNTNIRNNRRQPRSRKPQKKRRKEEIINLPKPKKRIEEYALWDWFTYRIAPPNLSGLGPRENGFMPCFLELGFNRLIFIIFLLVPLDLNCTVCTYFSYYVQSLFLLSNFAVDAYHFHINLIAYSVFMCELLGYFYDIINVYLALIQSGCNLPINNWCKVK